MKKGSICFIVFLTLILLVFSVIVSAQEEGDSDGIKIGIVDTGFDSNHPDLENLEVKAGEPSWFERHITEPFRFLWEPWYPSLSHGNAVASVLGETAGKDKGEELYGYCKRAYNNYEELEDFKNAMRDAVDDGMQIINVSMGWGPDKYTAEEREKMQKEFDKFIEEEMQGVLLVVGAGNKNEPAINEPLAGLAAKHDNIIAVGAINQEDERWEDSEYDGSNYGDAVTVAAPGEKIRAANSSSFLLSDYFYKTGTSIAAPYVAGVAAQIWAANPELTPEEIKKIIEDTADPHQFDNDKALGAGIINIEKAVAKAAEKGAEVVSDKEDPEPEPEPDPEPDPEPEPEPDPEPEPEPETCLVDDCDRGTFLGSEYCMTHRREYDESTQEPEAGYEFEPEYEEPADWCSSYSPCGRCEYCRTKEPGTY